MNKEKPSAASLPSLVRVDLQPPLSLWKPPKATFICHTEGCNLSFSTKKLLRKHKLIHRVRKHVCQEPGCGRAFFEKSKLTRHMVVHNKKKEYECPICKKSFGYKANVKTHMRTHTGEKPFQCREHGCSRTFAQASNRNAHEKTHERKRLRQMQSKRKRKQQKKEQQPQKEQTEVIQQEKVHKEVDVFDPFCQDMLFPTLGIEDCGSSLLSLDIDFKEQMPFDGLDLDIGEVNFDDIFAKDSSTEISHKEEETDITNISSSISFVK
eukprot:snap_masked-scaffold_1-processed-gene-12.23-mRNA-1 protein AED:0.15 eAED:0.15 QI:0/-1/0/1/-1/1/1/0/265